MFSAADLIDALQQRHRRRFPLHPERPFGAFPPTWRAWFLSLSERVGAVVGAPAADFLAVFLARPLRPVPRAEPPIDRARALARLARQQWDPAPRDQRGLRRFAAVSSAVLHLVFAVLLLWLGLVPIGDAPPEARRAGEAMLVEYIGIGTPEETGGAAAPGDEAAAPSSSAASRPTTAEAAAAPSAAAVPPPPPAAVEAPTTPTEASAAVAPQPLAVTETPRPDIDFTLPAPVPREVEVPQLSLRVPEAATQASEVETFEARVTAPVLQPRLPKPAAPTVPVLRTEVVEVEALRTPSPVVSRQVSPNTLATPRLQVPELRTQPGEVALRPAPAPAPAPGTGTAAAGASASTAPAARPAASGPAPGTAGTTGRATTPAPTSGGRPDSAGAGRPAGAAPGGAGPSASPRPGAMPSPTRSDDWGASDRNTPGNSTAGRGPGLFNSDGSLRLPGEDGRAGGGLPPGTITEDFEKIDRMGTWLKRPPLDYTPSRFDRFWIPHENLLQEWVRRGVKEVLIPIPGTSKKMRCVVSLLQAAGGCSITDPNLQDQEATARPPPDVPFKPELQEDQDSLRRPPPTP